VIVTAGTAATSNAAAAVDAADAEPPLLAPRCHYIMKYKSKNRNRKARNKNIFEMHKE
jgi:hypothetical protein